VEVVGCCDMVMKISELLNAGYFWTKRGSMQFVKKEPCSWSYFVMLHCFEAGISFLMLLENIGCV